MSSVWAVAGWLLIVCSLSCSPVRAKSTADGAETDAGTSEGGVSDSALADGPRADTSADTHVASCSGPPTCAAASSATTCDAISGCAWSQCSQRNAGFVYSCGDEGEDLNGSCPPGCHISSSNTCIGASGDYYDAPLPCGDPARQTQDACIGAGGLWQGCTWNASVACVGRPTRQDCTGITDRIACVQQGCNWQ